MGDGPRSSAHARRALLPDGLDAVLHLGHGGGDVLLECPRNRARHRGDRSHSSSAAAPDSLYRRSTPSLCTNRARPSTCFFWTEAAMRAGRRSGAARGYVRAVVAAG